MLRKVKSKNNLLYEKKSLIKPLTTFVVLAFMKRDLVSLKIDQGELQKSFGI